MNENERVRELERHLARLIVSSCEYLGGGGAFNWINDVREAKAFAIRYVPLGAFEERPSPVKGE